MLTAIFAFPLIRVFPRLGIPSAVIRAINVLLIVGSKRLATMDTYLVIILLSQMPPPIFSLTALAAEPVI